MAVKAEEAEEAVPMKKISSLCMKVAMASIFTQYFQVSHSRPVLAQPSMKICLSHAL